MIFIPNRKGPSPSKVTKKKIIVKKLPSYHIVKKNETLYGIANKYNMDLTALMKLNRHLVPEKLTIGQKVYLTKKRESTKEKVAKASKTKKKPTRKYHIVRKGDTPYKIARIYGIGLQTLLSFNKSIDVRRLQIGQKIYIPEINKTVDKGSNKERIYQVSSGIKVGKGDFSWPLPVKGVFVRGFVPSGRKQHKGIDIAVPEGTSVLASKSGRVIYCGDEIKSYGNLVIIDHGKGITSVYAHLKKILVRKNQKVNRKDKIGLVGDTGRATGDHLHFEIRKNGEAVNPLKYL